MKHPERVEDYLDHIIEAIDNITNYISNTKDFSEFEKSQLVQDAIIRNFEIIGEAATQLHAFDANFKLTYPELPWSAMRGMRNRIAHGYFDVNPKVVWKTIINDLDDLESQVTEILKKLKTEP